MCIFGLYMALYKMLLLLLFLEPTSTKPQAEILKLNNVNGCNDISFGDHSILEGDRIPRLKTMNRRWKRNSVSLVSSVTTVMHRPISCVTSMAVSCHAPAVSMANGQKMWVLAKLAYLSVLLCAAL